MANHNIPQTVVTIAAADNFGEWLQERMKAEHITCEKLAQAIGIERKAILNYIHGKTSPRLDTLAVIFDYFGKTSINIELNPRKAD